MKLRNLFLFTVLVSVAGQAHAASEMKDANRKMGKCAYALPEQDHLPPRVAVYMGELRSQYEEIDGKEVFLKRLSCQLRISDDAKGHTSVGFICDDLTRIGRVSEREFYSVGAFDRTIPTYRADKNWLDGWNPDSELTYYSLDCSNPLRLKAKVNYIFRYYGAGYGPVDVCRGPTTNCGMGFTGEFTLATDPTSSR